MIVFPNCKINIGLHVAGMRADGYHDLYSVFYPLNFTDVLEAIPSGSLHLTLSGLPLPGEPDENLCLRAFSLLKSDFPELPAVHFYLHKAIPAGSGLGGGSSDAVQTLILLDRKFKLGLTDSRLHGYALQLGSDCPFFTLNRPCLVSGKGENLKPVDLDLSAYSIALVCPDIHVSTSWAFSQLEGIRENPPAPDLPLLLQQTPDTWEGRVVNDFEKPVFSRYPELSGIKSTLLKEGALYASLSGSGSTVFGIFDQIPPELSSRFPASCLFRVV